MNKKVAGVGMGLAMAVAALAWPATAQVGFGSGPRPVVSPEISPDGMVTFRIRASRAAAVRLTGNDMPEIGQGLDLTKGENGVWERAVGPVAPGSYRYRFDVDGVQVMDPVNGSVSESNGNAWSLVHVPGAPWMDAVEVPHGAEAEVTYYSTSLERFRRMHVYTPPGYEADGQTQYPVFYLLHGAFDCDDSWSTVGRAGFILDNLIAAGHAVPMIVVMPAGHTGPFQFGARLAIDAFVTDFEQDIVPAIESRYRVKPGRAYRALAGLSMGGAHTLSLAVRNLDHYAYLGVFSSGVFNLDGSRGNPGAPPGPPWEEQHKEVLDDASLKEGLKLFWFSTGVDDFLVNTTRATVETLRRHGFDVAYKESEGGHTWINWREYLHEFAQYLFRDGVTPVPVAVVSAAAPSDASEPPPTTVRFGTDPLE